MNCEEAQQTDAVPGTGGVLLALQMNSSSMDLCRTRAFKECLNEKLG